MIIEEVDICCATDSRSTYSFLTLDLVHWKEEAVRDKRLLIETAYDARPDYTRSPECIIVLAPSLDARFPCLGKAVVFFRGGNDTRRFDKLGRQATGSIPCTCFVPLIRPTDSYHLTPESVNTMGKQHGQRKLDT
jgi:hypothetical protein